VLRSSVNGVRDIGEHSSRMGAEAEAIVVLALA
jgi:hypothetical protein